MSFASGCKRELLKIENKRPCCIRAEHYGLLLFSRCFSPLEAQTVCENGAVARRLAQAAAVSGGVYAEVQTRLSRQGGSAHVITVPGEDARLRMLHAFGHSETENVLHIRRENLRKDCCTASFLRGVFLICGSVTDPNKAYRLECTTPRKALAEDLAALLGSVPALSASPSVARRGGGYVVYLKESAAVEDFLTYIGAVNGAMEFMQIKMYKETYNNLNRVSNFETANLDKTFSASSKQLAAIARIYDTVGIDGLPEELRETASLRLENPEMSLREMSERLSISRSGVNHRLRRILEFAETLGEPVEKP